MTEVSSLLFSNIERGNGATETYFAVFMVLKNEFRPNIEFAAASFVFGRYVNDTGDILKLNWLRIEEGIDFNLLKLTFKALRTKQWPSYLNLQRVSTCRELCSSDAIRLQGYCGCLI